MKHFFSSHELLSTKIFIKGKVRKCDELRYIHLIVNFPATQITCLYIKNY